MVEAVKTECCIAGGGPAGMMLGYLLARAGVDVVVLEKHADFLRDFRGDTIHPSTMQVMHELGLLEAFLKLPHQPVRQIFAQFGNERLMMADFSRLSVKAPFIAMMPQWDFLDFIADQGRAFSNFCLLMETSAKDLRRNGGLITGVVAEGPGGAVEIDAPLTVAADGRGSILRQAARLEIEDLGAPMDVLWFRLSRHADDTDETQGRFAAGAIFIMLNRGDYWQCAFVIPKGANERIRASGLPAFRERLKGLLPVEPARAEELTDWQQVKLLNVQVNRLKTWWRDGFLAIGDAAHAMSPLGGVGINLAIQDAVAAANILAAPLRQGAVDNSKLAAVQRRRQWPTRFTQQLQVTMQRRVIDAALADTKVISPPWFVRMMLAIPGLRDVPARLIGIGVRPEHVAADILAPPA